MLRYKVKPKGNARDQLMSGSSARICLSGCIILMEPAQPAHVLHSVNDLREYLFEITGKEVPVRSFSDSGPEPLIIVGKELVEQTSGERVDASELGDEGFLLKSLTTGGRNRVIVAGFTPKGTMFGLAALMKMIRVEKKAAYIERPVDIVAKPNFAKRAMHLNGWPIEYPYSFRSWNEKNWFHYIDLLSYQGVNLFFIWPFMDIIPVPLSAEDESYLQEVRRVVEYAQKKRGMEVWIMHSANRVASSDVGMSDPRTRRYWVAAQVDMNPAVPEQFEKILESREPLYRIVNNADGFCLIDSDPGGWPDSPLSEYMRIFQGMRAFLDEYNVHGNRAKLINWVLDGWGQKGRLENSFLVETIQAMKNALPEPWSLMVVYKDALAACRKQGVLAKTIFLPYGAIEGEPSYPSTNVAFEGIRSALDGLSELDEIEGLMGNAQTPLLQFPHTYFFLRSGWDYDYRNRNQSEVIAELSSYFYPGRTQLIADAYMALNERDAKRIHLLRTRLEGMVNKGSPDRLGVFGRKLFPEPLVVAKSLVYQLKVREAQRKMYQILSARPNREQCETVVEDYLNAVLSWAEQNGWQMIIDKGKWSRGHIKILDAEFTDFTEAASSLKKALEAEDAEKLSSFFEPIGRRLLQKYGANEVKNGVIEPMINLVAQAP